MSCRTCARAADLRLAVVSTLCEDSLLLSLLQFAAMLTLNLSHIPDAFVILPPNQSLSGHCDCSGVLINSLILDLGSQAINRDGEGELEVRQRRRRWKEIGKSFWNESHKTAPVCLSYLCTPDKDGTALCWKKQQKQKRTFPLRPGPHTFFCRLQFHKKSEQTSVTLWMVLKQRENRTTSTCHSPLFRKNSSCRPAEDCFSPSILFAAEVLSYERIFSSLYQCFPTLNAPEMRNESTSKPEEGPTKQEAKTSSQH